jgi:hypothetical protein
MLCNRIAGIGLRESSESGKKPPRLRLAFSFLKHMLAPRNLRPAEIGIKSQEQYHLNDILREPNVKRYYFASHNAHSRKPFE